MRIVLHEVTVDVGTGVALVGVGHDEFLARRLRGDCAPFAARRETRAATTAQAGGVDGREDFFRRIRERFRQRGVAAEFLICADVARAAGGDAAEHDAVAREDFHRRTRVRLAFGGSGEAFAQAVDARVLGGGFGPARGIEMPGGETGRALAGLAGVVAVRQMVE